MKAKKKKMKSISICLEVYLDELLSIRAKNSGESKSQLIRTLIKDSLVRTPEKRAGKSSYYNDEKGILRSVNKLNRREE